MACRVHRQSRGARQVQVEAIIEMNSCFAPAGAKHEQKERLYFSGTRSLSPTSSPPATVMNFLRFSSLTPLGTKRTEPSHMATLKLPSKTPPSLGNGFLASKATSTGLVHGTASPASTIMKVC